MNHWKQYSNELKKQCDCHIVIFAFKTVNLLNVLGNQVIDKARKYIAIFFFIVIIFSTEFKIKQFFSQQNWVSHNSHVS